MFAYNSRAQLLSELTRITAKPDETLKVVMPKGVAFHHSGLQAEERQLVERAFCSGRSIAGRLQISAAMQVRLYSNLAVCE